MPADTIRVWDAFVRVFHWSLVIAFFVAYISEPEDAGLALHVWAGYFVGGLVMMRVIWGFLGTRHARFSDFAYGPFRALAYLGDLARGRSKRYLGHSPAGAWMVFLLLIGLAATVLTGLSVLATEKHEGPLASLLASSSERALASKESESGDDLLEEIHETLANALLGLVVLHLLGVVVASVSHRENLIRAMVTGRKRPERVHVPAAIRHFTPNRGEPK